jgi:TonB family protein
MRRRSDDTLSIALCASLIVHVAIMFAAFETGVSELKTQLHRPPWSARERELTLAAETDHPPLIQPGPAEPDHPKPLSDTDTSEWGEAGGKGVALNSAPGDKPLSARQGPQNQSFGSRDPIGPAEAFPPEPSMSTVPPGQGGDGKMLMREALAGRGTEGDPVIVLTPPAVPPVPPPPPPQATIAPSPSNPKPDVRIGAASLDPSGRAASALPLGDTLGPAESPGIAEALTQPPAPRDSTGALRDLPDLVSAAAAGAAEVQDAIAEMAPRRPEPELALPVDERTSLAQAAESSAASQPSTPAAPSENQLTLKTTAVPTPTVIVPKGSVGSVASATGGAPGPPVPPADPAADTGLESDPFSKIPGIEFRNGKVEARSGRQVKPVRPRLTEAAYRDLLALEFPTVLMKVRIDATGKVQDVKVLRGSGSEAVDMPVYRAMWQWWFEPPKDKQGQPQSDVQLVAIHWG